MAFENWQRSYKIEIGTPDLRPEWFTSTPEFIRDPNISEDQLTVPSNAIKLSNLSEDGNDKRGFTFSLEASIGSSKNANASEMTTLKLYNLDADSVAIIEQKNCVVRVYAGYGDKVDLAYAGDVVSVTPEYRSADVIYNIKCKGGLNDLQTTQTSAVFTESQTSEDVVKGLIERFPTLALGFSDTLTLANDKETGGFSWNGSVWVALQLYIDRYNLTCSIQNGKIFLYPYQTSKFSPEFSSSTTNNYKLTSNIIKDIRSAKSANKVPTTDSKEVSGCQLSTFFIPIEIGQFFTVPDPLDGDLPHLKKYTGTYKVEKIGIKLESHGSAWDVVMFGTKI